MLNDITIQEIPSNLPPLPHSTVITMNLAIDAGSTETRTILYSNNGDESMPEVQVEPSTFAKLDYGAPLDDIICLNPKLMDSFEARLKTLSEEKYTILKGSLATKVGADKRSSSAKSKMEQDSTLVNIHSAVMMNILKLMVEKKFNLDNGVIVNVKLTLALPPEDTESSRISKLRKEFEGVYEAYFPRLNVKFLYSILPDDVMIVSECNATAMYYMGMMLPEDEDIDDFNAIVLECGGRSSSAAVIKGGVLISRAHRNFDIGGTNLLQILIDTISDKRASAKISLENAERALCSGYIKKGSTKTYVYEEINSAKMKFAAKLTDKLMEAVEGAELSADDIQNIVISGRIFGELTDERGAIVSPSLGVFVKQIYQEKWCSGTEVVRIDTKYPIPQGLVLYRLGTEQ